MSLISCAQMVGKPVTTPDPIAAPAPSAAPLSKPRRDRPESFPPIVLLAIPQPLFLRPGHQARLASNTNSRGRPVPRPNWVLQTSYRSHLARQPEGMRRFSTQFGGIAPRNKRGMPEFWSIALSCCSEIDLYRQWLTVSTRPAAAPGPRPRDLAHSFGPDRRSSRRRGLHPLV